MAACDKVAFSNTIRLVSLDPVPIAALTRQLLNSSSEWRGRLAVENKNRKRAQRLPGLNRATDHSTKVYRNEVIGKVSRRFSPPSPDPTLATAVDMWAKTGVYRLVALKGRGWPNSVTRVYMRP